MKRKRFSFEQIVAVLKQADFGLPNYRSDPTERDLGTDQLPLEEAVSGAGFGSGPGVQKLSDDNARLKTIVAESSLDKAVFQDVLSKSSPDSAHERGCRLRDGLSWLRRAPGLFSDGQHRSTQR